MKKLLLGALAVLSLNAFALEGTLKLGGTTAASTFDTEKSFSKYAPSVAFEVTQGFVIADLGVGIGYNGKTGVNDVAVVPAYALAKIKLFPVLVEPYFVAKVGTTLHTSSNNNVDADAYYGAGFGVEFPLVDAEILYTQTKVGNEDLDQVAVYFGIDLF